MAERPYLALVHKDPDSCFSVSFPDLLGVTTAGDTLEEAVHRASEVLEFAFEDWPAPRPGPRTLDELQLDPGFLEWSRDAVVVAVLPRRRVG